MSLASRRGSSLVEFVFAGIPIFFMIISILEISRGMWTYNTLSYATREASRLAVVHGENCVTPPNSCAITVATIAQKLADSSQGLLIDQMNVSLISTGGGASVTCNPLSSCLNNPSIWPSYPGNAQGSDVLITAVYPFESLIAIFFPGLGPYTSFTTVNLPASSQERIQF